MWTMTRRGLICVLAAGLMLVAVSAACGQTKWPAALSFSIGVSTDDTARIQTSAALLGPIGENLGAKVEGWWIAGGSESRGFVGDAYLDYNKAPVYLAGGRKLVVFGPAGILVSPGISGGEVKLDLDRISLQAIAGSLAFTPVTGGTRFTFAGNRSPSDEDIRAGRVELRLTDPASAVPVTVGLNALDLMDETGHSGDITIAANDWLTLFGESADFDGLEANAYGVRYSNLRLRADPTTYTMLTLYHRKVPIGFVPAAVGATQYFEDQTGWVLGIYHQLGQNRGVGLYADKNDEIVSFFQYVPL